MQPAELLWKACVESSIISVCSTGNSSYIACGSVDRVLRLYDSSGKVLWAQLLDNEVWSVAISKNGRSVAAGTANKNPPEGKIYIFELTGKLVYSYNVESPVWGLDFDNAGNVLVAASWDNCAYQFINKDNDFRLSQKAQLGSFGLYGIRTNSDGSKTAIASYDNGIFILNNRWHYKKKTKIKLETGLYNMALASSNNAIYCGCRDGTFVRINNMVNPETNISSKLTDRPVCGISCDVSGLVLASGSFDGSIYLSSNTGNVFWSYQTNGEVWSTSMSDDGSIICVGSGDGFLYCINNRCNMAAITEIILLEENVKKTSGKIFLKYFLELLGIYSKNNLVEYGLEQARRIASNNISAEQINRLLYGFVYKSLCKFPLNCTLHYQFASLAEKIGERKKAIEHYLVASKEPKLYHKCMSMAGRNYESLGYESAAKSCYRRAIIRDLTPDTKSVMYNLGRSYEDAENWREAGVIYQVLSSWDFSYRNVWDRLENVRNKINDEDKDKDYTGVTVNLLGKDSPGDINVDGRLKHILKSRSKELHIDSKNRSYALKVIQSLESNYELPLALKDRLALEYSEVAYLKYDYLPAEDEAKKQLEMLYEMVVLEKIKNIETSLDIGAATGRHPMLLTKKGIKSYGIDIEKRAMQYAKKAKIKSMPQSTYPLYVVGSGAMLPFTNEVFNLVTCMMGTFAHIPRELKEEAIREVNRVLTSGGIFIVSTWDIECPHLSYLTMYDEREKNEIKEKSLTIYQMQLMLMQNGFKIIDTIPFLMIPNVFVHELNIESLELHDLKRLVEIDLATRSIFPSMHGEMYLMVGQKG